MNTHDQVEARERRTSLADVANDLRGRARGTVVAASETDSETDSEADSDPGLWNSVAARPGVRLECRDTADVRAGIAVAAAHGVRVAVWGGRHDIVGRNAGTDALVLDLRRLRSVQFDPAAGQVVVGGGATTQDLADRLPADRVTTMTANPEVGIVGAAAGGGYGPLVSAYGLVSDQVTAADLVLADGSVTRAARDHDEDLYWAMRGGGSGFGVVTSMTLRTHALAQVLSVSAVFSADDAVAALTTAAALVGEHPFRASVLPAFVRGPDGTVILVVNVQWTGDEDDGRRAVAELTGLPGATVQVDLAAPYRETFSPSEAELWPWGKRWHTETVSVAALDDEVATIIVEHARRMPVGGIVFLHDFHGAGAAVDPHDSAFGLRRPHWVVAATGGAGIGDDLRLGALRAWARDAAVGLAHLALPGGYVSFIGPEDPDRVGRFYGAENRARLDALRRRVDPAGVFTGVLG